MRQRWNLYFEHIMTYNHIIPSKSKIVTFTQFSVPFIWHNFRKT